MDPKSNLINSNDKYLERQKLEEELEKNAFILIQHKKLQRIDSFTGYFEFLHNNFMTPVYFEGSLYPSVTHAYHAARSADENTRKAILNADSFHTVAKIATRIEDPENWAMNRLKMMERLVRDKFRRSRELQEKLKATDKRELIMTYEEETHGNLFWGMAKSKGQNQLGRILMKIRDDIINNKEVINWITSNFDLVSDINFLPEISLVVNKNNNQIDHVVLKNKPFYKFGSLDDSDVVLAHPSISRLHAIIVCDKNLGVVFVDLRSKAGTKLDDDILKDHIPYRLKDGKKLNFGMSTRDYIITIDLSKVRKVYEREKLKLEDEMKMIKRIQTVSDKNKNEMIKKTFKLDTEESSTVFVNNVPQHATEENIKKLFEEQFGEIANLQWPNDRETGFKKPYLFIQFKDIETAKEAVDYGIIGYEADVNHEDDFEDFNEQKKSYMMKIKFADNDKYKPNFSRSTFNKREADLKDKSKYKADLKREYNNVEKRKKKSRKEESSSSESDDKNDSSSDYYSSDSKDNSASSSDSSSSSESQSSSETEKVKHKKNYSKRKRRRSDSSSRSHGKRRRR